jgi:SAM-dependent MidA family methyltransferase
MKHFRHRRSKVEPYFTATFPSYRDFVDDALFHRDWGYYSRGRVQFGEGGHYDTFPNALSPLFGQMLAGYAYRLWRRWRCPATFEICELGAGNGQLCLDALLRIEQLGGRAGWARFARALRYRIVERSPSLIERQRRALGPLSKTVVWTRADLSQRAPRGVPFGGTGLLFANEVLDCLAHHKVVPQRGMEPAATIVVPTLRGRVRGVRFARSDGFEWAIPRNQLAGLMSDEHLREQVTFHEVQVALDCIPGLEGFMRRHYPEFFPARRAHAPYFACPQIEVMIRNSARLYDRMQAIWIDYGGLRSYHLRTAAHRRVCAGPPRSGASVYRDPGRDDITFMVDFSVVARAARAAGFRVKRYGEQGELARLSGVELGAAAVETILQHRALSWLLALTGAGAESEWRRGSLTWKHPEGRRQRLRPSVRGDIEEFLGKRARPFWMIILEKP